MENFKLARIRLTTWYLLIVTFVTVVFSIFIYRNVISELQQSFEAAELRIKNQTTIFTPRRTVVLSILSDDFERARHIVFLRLLTIDAFIISISGIAAYFLAGKTLHPIELTIEDQKRFVSDASHELRTPLTVMKSEIEVALRGKDITSKDTKKLLESNLEEVDKMQKLTNYLLSLNKYESGIIKLQKEKINLSQIIKRVFDKHKIQAKQKKVSLSLNLQKVIADINITSIEELLSILLDNAIKYTPPKGKVKLSLKSERRRAIIQVSDTGIGIKASHLPYIFDRFYRADSARSKHFIDGYGLGLSIAKSITQMHKGKIEVWSTPGKGTTFKVTFPL